MQANSPALHAVNRKAQMQDWIGPVARCTLLVGIVVDFFFRGSLGAVHVSLPFVLAMTNIASALTVCIVYRGK